MIEITVKGWQPSQGIEVARELQSKGYTRGVDFDWAYHKPKYDDTSYDLIYNRYCIFKFYKDELATWFALLYQ